jgi:hypothetical protein
VSRAAACLLAVAALLPAGCGGEAELPPQVGLRAAAGTPAPGAAKVLERFVEAAGRGDAEAMWELLSEPTRASFGPTLERFRLNAAAELEMGIGPFAGSAELVLARAVTESWAVAAVAGEVERDGEREEGAYASALRRESGGWRLELGGVHFVGHAPGALEEIDDAEPVLRATAQSSARIERMTLWLDGRVVASRAARQTPFSGTVGGRAFEELRPGVHVVTVFAATDETAAAQAWPFEVEQ